MTICSVQPYFHKSIMIFIVFRLQPISALRIAISMLGLGVLTKMRFGYQNAMLAVPVPRIILRFFYQNQSKVHSDSSNNLEAEASSG